MSGFFKLFPRKAHHGCFCSETMMQQLCPLPAIERHGVLGKSLSVLMLFKRDISCYSIMFLAV